MKQNNNQKVKDLAKVFTKKIKNLTFTQVKETPDYYIYKLTYADTGELFSYEIFKRVVRSAVYFNNVNNEDSDFTHYVVYPGDNDFGKFAWSCSSWNRTKDIEQMIIDGQL